MIPPQLLVHEGLDGWLFLTGGTNFVTTLYQREGGGLPDSKLAQWRDLILRRIERAEALGVRYAHMIVPEKLTIYGDKQATRVVDPELAPAIRLRELCAETKAAGHLVDLVAPMRERAQSQDVYWRTDTHWNVEGCLLGYHELCKALGLTPAPDLDSRPSRQFETVMDLGNKLDPPRWEIIEEREWARDAIRIYANRIAHFLEEVQYGAMIHVGAHAKFINPTAPNAQKALLFGDSFSTPRTHLLTGLLAETVRELEFVWSANIDWALVEKARPDLLIFEISERFMALLANDRFSLPKTEFAQSIRAARMRWAHKRARRR
jgi:alginate O-acetyltransferase complex protein AlgJ